MAVIQFSAVTPNRLKDLKKRILHENKLLTYNKKAPLEKHVFKSGGLIGTLELRVFNVECLHLTF